MAASWTLVAVVAAVLCASAQAQTCVVADCPASECRTAVCVADVCADEQAVDGTGCLGGACSAGLCVPAPNLPANTTANMTGNASAEMPTTVTTTSPPPTTTTEAPEVGPTVFSDAGNLILAVESGNDVMLDIGNGEAPRMSIAGSIAAAETNAKAYTDTESAKKADRADIATLRSELGGVEAILSGKLTGLNTTQGNQLGALEADLAALDTAVATKASTADLLVLTTLLNQVLGCNDVGMIYSRTAKACVASPFIKAPPFGTCSNTNAGSMIFQNGDLQVCSGTAFEAVGGAAAHLGSTSANPANTCQQIFLAGQGAVSGERFIKVGSIVVRHYCQFTATAGIDRGGDGSSRLVPVKSCDNLKKYYGKTARTTVFIDLDGDYATTIDIVQSDCSNGVFVGGDGTTAAKAAVSCKFLPTVTGRRYVMPDLHSPFQVYCQGGWSLLMRIGGTSNSHVTNNGATCGGIVNPTGAPCKLSTATISRFFVQPGVQVTRVKPDAGNAVSYFQRAATDLAQWPDKLECTQRNSYLIPNPKYKWIITSFPTEANARANINGKAGDYTGSVHYFPSPYGPNQHFFCSVVGMRINSAFDSTSCCRDRSSGTLWVK